MKQEEKKYYTVGEFAAKVNRSYNCIYNLIKRKHLVVVKKKEFVWKKNQRMFVPSAELEKFKTLNEK